MNAADRAKVAKETREQRAMRGMGVDNLDDIPTRKQRAIAVRLDEENDAAIRAQVRQGLRNARSTAK